MTKTLIGYALLDFEKMDQIFKGLYKPNENDSYLIKLIKMYFYLKNQKDEDLDKILQGKKIDDFDNEFIVRYYNDTGSSDKDEFLNDLKEYIQSIQNELRDIQNKDLSELDFPITTSFDVTYQNKKELYRWSDYAKENNDISDNNLIALADMINSYISEDPEYGEHETESNFEEIVEMFNDLSDDLENLTDSAISWYTDNNDGHTLAELIEIAFSFYSNVYRMYKNFEFMNW